MRRARCFANFLYPGSGSLINLRVLVASIFIQSRCRSTTESALGYSVCIRIFGNSNVLGTNLSCGGLKEIEDCLVWSEFSLLRLNDVKLHNT